MEPNPDDNPLMVDLLWSDPKGVLVTQGMRLFKEGKKVMVWAVDYYVSLNGCQVT